MSKAKVGRPANTNSDETRRDILDAAIACFGESGYGSTSTRAIAKKAGVTVALIYHYFQNKDALFLEGYHELQQMTLDMAGEKLQSAQSLTSGWSELCEEVYSMHVQHPEIARFNAVVEVEAARNPEIASALYDQQWRQHFHRLAELAVRTGEIREGQEQELIQVMVVLLQGVIRRSLKASPTEFKLALQGIIKLFQGELVRPAKA